MSLKLITLAALGTAAQAATTYPYSKAKCITGHTSNFMKANGVPLVVIDSTAGFCFPANVEAYTGDKTTKSMLLRCVGKKIQFQKTTEEKCKGITANTAKFEITAVGDGGWSCEGTGLVQGVDTANYKVKGCTGGIAPGNPLPYTNSYCVADGTCAVKTGGTNADCAPKTTATTCAAGSTEGNGGKTANDCVFTVNSKKFTCNKEKTQVTISSYTGALCQEPVKNAYVFKSNDGICHATDTVQPKPKASPSPAPKAKAAPAPAPSGDASTNALATGFAVAGLIVSLVLM